MSVSGKRLNQSTTPVLSDIPEQILSANIMLRVLLERVRVSQLCPGNPDQDFIDLIAKEGGQFLSTGGVVVATLDTSSKVVLDGHAYDKTIRASDCKILSNGRCSMCTRYRPHLRVKRSRRKPDGEVATKIARTTYAERRPNRET